ncbi:aspartate aminotransferase family protein [Paramaledivibacter caminithermalis]|jgi:acetylornithine/N-succinyldiaminopimelate aminotransferase|uniref:Acetylornithine aminotransferase n=1 Tax=Paramaledivibacter caminithermalis (strain DSM 15212 / CIP 107654 / DViRD3) TaxID=1121301 RepID=A0A1M6SN45_PARC5|nr:aspartate aminotransferase family protein [Paramaledivibacter caminithermalis]SHK46070.1 acetylornithine/N-succinyldiaminopimelate aminotransferase [Paramaledivibacter caminithermalis DSM 15212]
MKKNYQMEAYSRFNVVFEKGLGTKLYDINGKKYLDFVAGVAVNCLGHCHPSIIEALNEQSQKLIHVSNLYWTPTQNQLAKKLISLSDHNTVFFCNSGTEANEAAIKIARKYGKLNGVAEKYEIITMENSFHGRTMGALSVTAQPKYQKYFMPILEGIKSVRFNYIDDLKESVSEKTCAVIIEPIQGEGGIIRADKEFLLKAKELCEKNDALLIFDEVQCGIGRTGDLFAYQSFGVVPDIVCLAKGLGGGFPIGAVLANKRASVFKPGDHGCTFGGNPLGCAVSLAVLEELIDNKVINGVKEKEKIFKEEIEKLMNKYSFIKKIDGKGLMLGIHLDIEAKKVVSKAFDKGLLIVGAGNNVVRIVPPLNITKEEINDGVQILKEVFEELS